MNETNRDDAVPVDAQFDERSLETYRLGSRVDPLALFAGVAAVGMLAAAIFFLPKLAAASAEERSAFGEVAPLEYVEARLLKLGEIKDPDALPDRIVPALPTAPEEVIPLDRDAHKPEPAEKKPKKPKKQADAVTDDKLRQVFDRARAFAEIQDDYIPEGHPDGVPDGDVTDPALASMGQTYGRRITRLIQERLVVPTLISEAQKSKLSAKILLRFDIDMTISKFEFVRRSGNKLFDDAIQTAIDRVRLEVRNLPAPPEVIAPTVFGGGIAIRINGRDSQFE
jgi:hypothetical protein